MWACAFCTLRNVESAADCDACGLPRRDPPPPQAAPSSSSSSSSSSAPSLSDRALLAEPSSSVTRAALSRLEQCLAAQSLQARSFYRLCSPCDHVSQAISAGSTWACGYRNIQILCSALFQATGGSAPSSSSSSSSSPSPYRAALFGGCGFIPSVPALQGWIERAWSLGFDPEGKEQLGGTLRGTAKWIGTAEVAVLLRSFGVQAQLVAFHALDDPLIPQIAVGRQLREVQAARRRAEDSLLLAAAARKEKGRGNGKGGKKGGKDDFPPLRTIESFFGGTGAGSSSSSSAALREQAEEDKKNEAEEVDLVEARIGTAAAAGTIASRTKGNTGAASSSPAVVVDLTADDDSNEEDVERNVLEQQSMPLARSPSLVDRRQSSLGTSSHAADPALSSFSSSSSSSGGTTEGDATFGPSLLDRDDAATRIYLRRRHEGLLRWLEEYFCEGGARENAPLRLVPDVRAREGTKPGSSRMVPPATSPPPPRPFPLYFQHDGHSRTVVGFEAVGLGPLASSSGAGGGGGGGGKRARGAASAAAHFAAAAGGKGGGGGGEVDEVEHEGEEEEEEEEDVRVSLLLFDPLVEPATMGKALSPLPSGATQAPGSAAPSSSSASTFAPPKQQQQQLWRRLVKRGLHTLHHPTYEALYVPRHLPVVPIGSPEWEALKTLDETHIISGGGQ